MASRAAVGNRIEALIKREDWPGARKVIERELTSDADNHWMIARLGLTYYEEREYQKSLELFEQSRKILPSCPLTIWNLAGALDMIGKDARAAKLYRWIIRTQVDPDDDPCWESPKWAEAMKADAVYRLAGCEADLGRKTKAIDLYHRYLDLLLNGVEGIYSFDDVKRQIQKLQPVETNGKAGRRTRRILESVA